MAPTPMRPYTREGVRNREWFHLINDHIISMPDKWEYPWFAAWDLAFTRIALATVDLDFAKQQLDLMLREVYLHPSGQIPAYEWNFSDVNPPVHAWAAIFLYRTEQALRGKTILDFLKRVVRQADDEFRLVGQSQGPLRQEAFSKAASLGSTISACSTAARHCRPAAIWSRPMGRRGWLYSARTCSRSRSKLRHMIRSYEDLAANFTMRFPLDRPSDEYGRLGRHVGRGGRVLLRCPAPARRQRHAPQGPLDGRLTTTLCHDRD